MLEESMQAVEGAVTDRAVKEARLRRSTNTWRRESAGWAPAPPVLSDGEVVVPNLKHGPNVLTLEGSEFPRYSEIRPEHIERGIAWMSRRSGIEFWGLYTGSAMKIEAPWELLMHPLEAIVDQIERTFATIKFMKDVVDNSPRMQKAWKKASFIKWRALLRTRQSEKFLPHFKRLLTGERQSEAQRRAVAATLMVFERDGVNMQEECLYREEPAPFMDFIAARNEMFKLTQDWETNIDNDMLRKSFLVRKPEELEGIPAYVLADAAAAAVNAGYPKATAEAGPWMITLDDAMVDPILRHAKGQTFREFVYGTRARVAFLGGSGAGDNTPVLMRMLLLRKTYANLIGYTTWADLAFTTRMSTMQQVYAFLSKLRREALPVARRELRELQDFARSQGAEGDLDHFDLEYWRERLVESKFSLHEEYLRQFFQMPVVLDGLFKLLRRLFGVEVVPADGEAQVWDEHVRFFRVREVETGELLASFFLDAYRRRGRKRPGFWVETIQEFSALLGNDRHGPRLPAVHLICDFAPPEADGKPALLTHVEVAKLFHVMGGALRHLLSNQTEGLVAGANGLEMDVRDFPAYFLERWAHDKSTLRTISRHVETGDPLPEPAIETLVAARTFHNGMRVLKRTATAQVDLDLHAQYDPKGEMGVFDVAKLIEAEFAVIPPRVEDHELCSLPINGERGSGLFAGLWSEALAADVLVEFESAGFDNEEAIAELGRRFRRTLLAPGGGRAPAATLHDFHGRLPSFAAFLRHAGLQSAEPDSVAVPSGLDPADFGDGDEYDNVYEEDDDYVEFDDPEEASGYDEGEEEPDQLVS